MSELTTTYEWNTIPWRKLERKVFKLQKPIYQASQRGDIRTVRKLQKLLMKSWSAKCLAVRKVTQENKGRKTAGVDGVKSLEPSQRFALIKQLKLKDKSQPTRRVWIPKPGKDEKRPLGIPTMYERALQALVKLTLEPEWEAKFEPNSYGFRPGRSAHDAIKAIWDNCTNKPKFVLDADISKCFDKINHKALLDKVNTFPTLHRQLKAWLKAGVVEDFQFHPTEEGTPQGGCISPLLANIALHGMEERLLQYVETVQLKSLNGGSLSKAQRRKTLAVIRYADDFVVMHRELSVVEECQKILNKWLVEMGLELKPSQTRLVHTLEKLNESEPGFDFLGFNIRQFPMGKHHSGKTGGKVSRLLGFKTIIRPSRDSIKAHWNALTEIVDSCIVARQSELIQKLNPVIRGWTNYFSTVNSKKTYNDLDNLLWQKLRAWANRRHPTKSSGWKAQKYWKTIRGDKWRFATAMDSEDPILLFRHSDTRIKQFEYVKVRDTKSPLDGDLVYWSSRLGRHPECSQTVATLMKRQKGKCPHCNLHFRDGDLWEKDHIIPRAAGGKNGYENLQLLHRHCHDEKTRTDLKHIKDKRYA
jgi:RNA-directed DNA polymerase